MNKAYIIGLIVLVVISCTTQERNCADFKDGTFTFTSIVDGKETTTRFVRKGSLEIDYFNNKIDSSSVRWINNCEYVIKKINPKSMAEKKPIHIKILSTTKESYLFEYGNVGNPKKIRGTAIKTN